MFYVFEHKKGQEMEVLNIFNTYEEAKEFTYTQPSQQLVIQSDKRFMKDEDEYDEYDNYCY